ncbi:MAG: ribonuclease HII [Candidatus Micrarchaeia archaeon]
MAGGDEAGRGSVIGPLVVSLVAIGKNKEKRLADIGVRDSKQLTPRQREFLFGEIYKIAEEIGYYVITNEEINAAMRNGISLNELEAMHFSKLLDSLNSRISKLYIDSPDVIPGRFGTRISMYSKKPVASVGVKVKAEEEPIRVIAEHKADVRYPIVSAASIVAKVIRDREIERIKQELGIDFGSGYPSDKLTRQALKSNLSNAEFQGFVRQKWRTLQEIRQSHIEEFFQG